MESVRTKVKILVSCHIEADVIKNDVFHPIQVGCALTENRLHDMFYDDVGENISSLNQMYCELTAQYWAWKNLDADYYGFCHYRRYFNFSNVRYKEDEWKNVTENFLSDDVKNKYSLDSDTVENFVSKYDVVISERKDVRKMLNQGWNVRQQYTASKFLHEKDLDIMLAVISEKSPKFTKYAEQYLRGYMTSLNNLFVMKKEFFAEFCEWEFGILDECMRRIDMSDYSIEAMRTISHLAERLLNIYVMYLTKEKKISLAEVQTVYLFNTTPMPDIKPAYAENNVAIALAANNYYVPYVSVLLVSMRENFNKTNNYDIIIMHRDISAENQKYLKYIFQNTPNVSLRFLNMSCFSRQFENLHITRHFVVETYFRLFLPELLPSYDKLIYLDCDTIVCADIADLFKTDVEGFLLAACHDADTAGLYNGFEPGKKNYMDNILKIEKPYEYFQAGVILFNLAEFRKIISTKQIVEFACSNKWELLDQDVLNFFAQGKVKFVDMAWNVMFDWRKIRIDQIISLAPKYLYDEYMTARANPKIIHFAGEDKPWQNPDFDFSDFAEVFWRNARLCPFYEQLLFRMVDDAASCQILKNDREKKLSYRFKRFVRTIADGLFPRGTLRRNVVKRVYRKITGDKK